MSGRPKVWLVLLVATTLFGVLVGSASARNLSMSNQSMKATWANVEFISPSAGVTVRCPLTLEGTLHSRTIAKVINSLIGYITRARVAEALCTGGSVRMWEESLPWHLKYGGFEGTLPDMTSIKTTIVRPAFNVTALYFGIRVPCTYRTTDVREKLYREFGSKLWDADVEGSEMNAEGLGCGPIYLWGTNATVTLLGSTTRITVTLI